MVSIKPKDKRLSPSLKRRWYGDAAMTRNRFSLKLIVLLLISFNHLLNVFNLTLMYRSFLARPYNSYIPIRC